MSGFACDSFTGFNVHSFGTDANVLVGTPCIYGCGTQLTEQAQMHRLRNIAASLRLKADRLRAEADRLSYRAESMAARMAAAE